MKRALIAAVGLTVTGLVVSASPAFAFDCIRVSGSQQGLMQSTKSGNWLYFTIHDLVQGAVDEGDATPEQGACVEQKWAEMGEPSYFALGIGVAGAHGATQSGRITDADFYELAKNAPVKVMTNGKGVDHLDDAINVAIGSCLG